MPMKTLLEHPEYKTVEYIVSQYYAIRCTRRFKSYKLRVAGARHEDILVSMGQPNYLAKAFIKKCKKNGEPFTGLRVKLFPKKKKKVTK